MGDNRIGMNSKNLCHLFPLGLMHLRRERLSPILAELAAQSAGFRVVAIVLGALNQDGISRVGTLEIMSAFLRGGHAAPMAIKSSRSRNGSGVAERSAFGSCGRF